MRRPLSGTIAYPAFLGAGLTLWAAGLLAVRSLGADWLASGPGALFYLTSLIVAVVLAVTVRALSPRDRLVEGMAVVALAGLLADAALLRLFPFAYGPDETAVRLVMAWRAATGALLILAGVLLEQRPLRK